MNNHHESEQIGPFVLDALDPEEREVFEAHLVSCESCRDEVAELRSVVSALPLALAPTEPSPLLRERIINEASPPGSWEGDTGAPRLRSLRQRPRRRYGIFLAAAAALVAALGIWNVSLHQQYDDQHRTLQAEQALIARLAGGATVSPLSGQGQGRGAVASIVQPRAGQAYFVVAQLPSAAANRVYQLWFMRGSVPKSMGTFRGSRSLLIIHLPRSARGFPLAAVTVEPGPKGSPTPTGPKVLVGKLSV